MQCLFRYDVSGGHSDETALCRLLEQMAGQESPNSFRIPRSACEACVEFTGGKLLHSHPVFPSLLLQFCDAVQTESSSSTARLAEGHERRLDMLFNEAVAALTRQERKPIVELLPSCDVILCANQSSERLRQSIESVLDQTDVVPFLHLVDTGAASEVFSEFSLRWNVRRYQRPAGTSILSALHSLVTDLTSSFVAIQLANGISEPDRLSKAIRRLESEGAEFFVSDCPGTEIPRASLPSNSYRRIAHPGTFIFRRCSFVDMGGAVDIDDDDVDLLYRAHQEGRGIVVSKESLVIVVSDETLPTTSGNSVSSVASGRLITASAKGFPVVPVACDVVLPFHGRLDYVTEAMESLLQQTGCEIVIHVVDDASPEDTTDFLRSWSSLRNVRTYRNTRNIGQFQSFNNVFRYFETPLCAVQDADDISLPHRISQAGQMLHYSGADVYGGTVELFGDDEVIRPTMLGPETREKVKRSTIRGSFFPVRGTHSYFLENPTAMFRVSTFQALGGFADFGDRLMNRASLDAEFQQRLLYHGVRFAVSREVVVRYRVHSSSATQDNQSGWGTAARNNAGRNLDARVAIFERGGFDPRSFGSLGRFQDVTVRLT